jgi:hypothetical protein
VHARFVPLTKPHNHAITSSAYHNYFKGLSSALTHFTQHMMAQHATSASAPPQMANRLHAFSDVHKTIKIGSCHYRHPLTCFNSLTPRRYRLIYTPHSAHCIQLCFQQLWQFPFILRAVHLHDTAMPGMPKPLMYLSSVVQ